MSEPTDEQLLTDIKDTADQVEGLITSQKYQEKGKYSITQIRNRYGSFTKAREKTGLPNPETQAEYLENITSLNSTKFKAFEEIIQENCQGRYGFQELKDIIEENVEEPYHFASNYVPQFIEYLNNRDNGLKITRSSTGGHGGGKMFINNESIDQYREYTSQIPDEYEEVFRAGINTGRSPKTICAAICYLIDNKHEQSCSSQRQAADKFDVTSVSVRNVKNFIKEEGLIEEESVEVEK